MLYCCICLGARRFVVLDFGKPVLLTDVIVPMCGDLASLSIDIWIDSEETDGHRLVVSSDIGVCSLIMNDIMPPPVCRFLKVNQFLHATAATAVARLSNRNFVCPSHGWISQVWCKLG